MNKSNLISLMIALVTLFASCKKDKPALPDNLLQFEVTEKGIDDATEAVPVKLILSRVTETEIAVSLSISEDGVLYGSDYTTSPSVENQKIDLIIPSGESQTSFEVRKNSGVVFTGEESITFKIESAGAPILIGQNKSMILKFSEIISQSNEMQLDGGSGGAEAVNSVYVELSTNTQTPIRRDSWNLGFNNGSEFRVILNYTLANAMGQELPKNNLNDVTPADTVGMVLKSSFSPGDLNKVDDASGDLTKTVIKEISANDADNKVYILNLAGIMDPNQEYDPRNSPEKWVKIRVLRNGNGYTLQYADIADTDFKTINISKKSGYQFSFVSLLTGNEVVAMPAQKHWDIQWGKFSYFTAFGASNIYYPYSDMVMINNRDGVTAAEIMTSEVSYDEYSESNINTTTFSNDRAVIGSKWRVAGQSGSNVLTDRFYVIKDTKGNYYKLKFISFTESDGGTRGKPVIAYKLVKKG